jgi:hypothetical protein
MVSATMLVCATVTQMLSILMIMTAVYVAWAVMSALSMLTEMLHAMYVQKDISK